MAKKTLPASGLSVDITPKEAAALSSCGYAKETPKPTVKVMHMHAGLDLIGSKTSHDHRASDIYELEHGLLLVSKKNKRKILVPFTNIRGYELL